MLHLRLWRPSICGVSAIAAKGAIDADHEDASYAIAAILALAPSVSLPFRPSATPWDFPMMPSGCGGTSRGQYGGSHSGRRTVLRCCREVRGAGQDSAQLDYRFRSVGVPSHGHAKATVKAWKTRAVFLWQKFPKFVLGFYCFLFWRPSAHSLSSRLPICQSVALGFLLTFAGMGLQTNIRELRKHGLRPLAVGAVGEFAIAAVTLALIFVASRLFGMV